MPAARLYFDDPYLCTFGAHVTKRSTRADQPAVALDRSAFYPEGGGQPGDRGTLNNIAVLDTQSDDHDEVWHILAAPLDADDVQGTIDWTRRFDFMQQHHGQHLLSAAAEQYLNARTLAVHLGEDGCTVDLDTPSLTAEQAATIEIHTNEMIWADVPIHARFVSPEELRALTLRKLPQAYERIRIVSAGDFDHSPCGGTHPHRTGEVGSLLIRRWERHKGGVRVDFVCGSRALRDARWKNEVISKLAADLHVGLPNLAATIDRLRSAEERQRKALAQAQEQLLMHEAEALVRNAQIVKDRPVVVGAWDDQTLDQLRFLARQITERGGVALLGLRDGAKAQLVFARAADLPYDMGTLLRTAATLIGGRGGGKPEAAQGGGPDVAQLDAALAAALAQLRAT